MAETIHPVSLSDETQRRYLNYALSVISSRALPDVRDGLKPVQRRILYTMFHELHLAPDGRPAKCARIAGDVVRACVHLIDNPDATTAVLLDRVKGPDFPLGGKVITDRATLRKIYEDGSGSIKVQAEWKLEDQGKGKQAIIVTSIPYGVNKGKLENDIGQLIEQKQLPHLLNVTNETNEKEGLRIALELRPGA